MPVFQYRFGNGIEQAKAIIDAGIAGKPFMSARWKRCGAASADYYAVPWRGKWATELGGVLMGHAIHPHDLFTYLMGDVSALFGRVATRVNPIEVEDCISASLVTEIGALAQLHRHARLGRRDDPHPPRLRERHLRERPRAPTIPATSRGRSCRATPRRRPRSTRCSRTGSTCRRASRRRWRASTMR